MDTGSKLGGGHPTTSPRLQGCHFFHSRAPRLGLMALLHLVVTIIGLNLILDCEGQGSLAHNWSMGSQKVRHHLMTERQQQQLVNNFDNSGKTYMCLAWSDLPLLIWSFHIHLAMSLLMSSIIPAEILIWIAYNAYMNLGDSRAL